MQVRYLSLVHLGDAVGAGHNIASANQILVIIWEAGRGLEGGGRGEAKKRPAGHQKDITNAWHQKSDLLMPKIHPLPFS